MSRKCDACGLSYEPRAEGQRVCTFRCAKLLQMRAEAAERAEKAARAERRRAAGNIRAALAETRANVFAMRVRPS